MSRGTSLPGRDQSILLIGPKAPPSGGMAVQAELLQKSLRGEGVLVEYFPSNFSFPDWLRPLAQVPGARTVLRAILIWFKLWPAVGRARVIHVLAASWLYFFTVVTPAVVVSRLRRKRVVLNYRGGEAGRFFRRYHFFASPILKLATVVTAPSEFLALVLGRYFSGSIAIVPNILDFSAFQFRQRVTFAPRMLVTRQLEDLYDLPTVLSAFRSLQEHFPKASLWIAGTGSLRARLEALAAQWGLRQVRFLGHVPHSELPTIYDQCDILLNASRVDNFPGSLLEASAAGLIVISTGVGGIPYIYQHEKSAFLVEPGDWKAMARSVERVLRNSSEARQIVVRALACTRNCEWSSVRQALVEIYGFASLGDRKNVESIAPVGW